MFLISLKKIKKAIGVVDLGYFTLRISRCPLHGKSLFVRLNNTLLGIRCVICGAAPIATSITSVLIKIEPDFKNKKIYELSAGGPFFEFLKRNVEHLTFSEYYDNVNRGDINNGVMCQDVEHLTFDDAQFDICTCTEVFEHVPNDKKGFEEIFRVLKDKGIFIFTVPLQNSAHTVTRALRKENEIVHVLEPQYHDDSIRGTNKVLVFRDYGHDIASKLIEAGFSRVGIFTELDCAGFGHKKEVIVAHKNPICGST